MKLRIICWGTGKIANAFMDSFERRYASFIDIVCFCDNDSSKYGALFRGKTVKPFECVSDYDNILVLTSYYSDIRKQLIARGVDANKIINEDSLKDIYVRNNWTNKRVAFYGDRYSFEYVEFLAKYTFKEYCFYEKGKSFPDAEMFDAILLCPPRLVAPKEIDNYQKTLALDVSQYKYFFRDDYMWFLDSAKRMSFGNKNPDKVFCIIHGQDSKSGWGNLLLRIARGIHYAEENGMIPVIDMQNIKNQYLSLEKFGKVNIWNEYFEPINDYSLDDVYKSKNVIVSGNDGYQTKCNSMERIQLNQKMQNLVENEYKRLFPINEKVIGVVYRGTDMYSAYQHPHPMGVEKFVSLVKEKMQDSGCPYIFLATEIEDVTCFFKKKFGSKVFFTNQQRYSSSERRFLADVHFKRANDEYQKGVEYLVVLELLAKCSVLLGKSSATTICAEALRGRDYEKKYII